MNAPKITKGEIKLIKAAQAGDEQAFAKLFRRYKRFVEHLLYQYLNDVDEAKDVCNIVFLKVHSKLSKFKTFDSFGGWLRILTTRTAIDYLRSIDKKRKVTGEVIEDRLSETIASDESEDGLVNHMTYVKLLKFFDTLPAPTRKVCLMFYEENLTIVQIAARLRMPTGTIKAMLSRTRTKMKNYLNV